MKTSIKIILRLIPIVVLGIKLNQTIILHSDVELIIDDLITGLLAFLFTTTFLCVLFLDIRVYARTHLKLSFMPTVIGIAFILSFFTTKFLIISRDNSPVLLQAGWSDGDADGFWFEFRKDGTYKFGSAGRVGASYWRGIYILKDSLITLDRQNIDNIIQSKSLVIRDEKYLDTLQQFIYQVNLQHQIINKTDKLTVNIDKRK